MTDFYHSLMLVKETSPCCRQTGRFWFRVRDDLGLWETLTFRKPTID